MFENINVPGLETLTFDKKIFNSARKKSNEKNYLFNKKGIIFS